MLSERDTVLHSWCRQADWSAPTIVGGAGARIHTADGRSILDMSSLAECCNLGHQHPKVVAAIREQAQKLCFVTSAWGAEPRAQARRAAAREIGIRRRPRVLHARRRRCERERGEVRAAGVGQAARHASSRATGPITVRATRRWRCPATVARGTRSIPKRSAFCTRRRRTPTAARTAARPPKNAAAAAQRTSARLIDKQDRTWPRSSWSRTPEPTASSRRLTTGRALRAQTRSRNVYLIADEVMSGFGRCGEWFAWQRYGEEGRPDLMTLAKGLTGAHLPLGAVVVSAEVAATSRARDVVYGTDLLRASTLVRGRRRRRRSLRRRTPDRAIAQARRADVRASESFPGEAFHHRRRARRRRPVRGGRARARPWHARIAGGVAGLSARVEERWCATRCSATCRSPSAAT